MSSLGDLGQLSALGHLSAVGQHSFHFSSWCRKAKAQSRSGIKFLLDENVDARLLPFLLTLGHDVASVGQDYFYGTLDEDVLAMAHQEYRIFITNDRDFDELIFHCFCSYKKGSSHETIM
jgi:hypothetical protein